MFVAFKLLTSHTLCPARFRWSQNARTKVDTFVEFPLSGLDMSNYLLRNLSSTRFSNANSCLYDLAAAIVHHGNGMGSGM